MNRFIFLISLFLLFGCTEEEKSVLVDDSIHLGLQSLDSPYPFKTLYCEGVKEEADQQSVLVDDAYNFLSAFMGEKDAFCLLVVAPDDWERNAYSPVVGMPEYYKGNLIVGAGKNPLSMNYEALISSFPEEARAEIISLYQNEASEFDLDLFFDKLIVHELTHSFQDPFNQEGYSCSRWLEELHANMGLYAYYQTRKEDELDYITALVDFLVENPPPDLPYNSLAEFDRHYYEMPPENYGFYQMRLTKAAAQAIDSLGNATLKPLNDFLKKYDESYAEKWTEQEFLDRLEQEVDPYFVNLYRAW